MSCFFSPLLAWGTLTIKGGWWLGILHHQQQYLHLHHKPRLAHYGPSFSWAVTDSMEWVSLSSADPRKPQAFRQVLRCGLTIIIESLLFFSLAIFLLDPQNPNSQKWGAGAREDLGGTLCARGKIESINVEFSEWCTSEDISVKWCTISSVELLPVWHYTRVQGRKLARV